MKKTLLSAAILAAGFSGGAYAQSTSETGQAIDKYGAPFDSLSPVPDIVFGLDESGEYAPQIDNRVATVVAIPGALASIPDSGCEGQACLDGGRDVLTTAAGYVVSGEDSTPPPPPEPEPTIDHDGETPLTITGSVEESQDACSASLPASVEFTFDISRADIDGGTGSLTHESDTKSFDFTCGKHRTEALKVAFSTVNDEASKSSDVTATFESNYHATNGDTSDLNVSIVFADDTPVAGGKNLAVNGDGLTETPVSESLKAKVTLNDDQALGGTFTAASTLYVYLD